MQLLIQLQKQVKSKMILMNYHSTMPILMLTMPILMPTTTPATLKDLKKDLREDHREDYEEDHEEDYGEDHEKDHKEDLILPVPTDQDKLQTIFTSQMSMYIFSHQI